MFVFTIVLVSDVNSDLVAKTFAMCLENLNKHLSKHLAKTDVYGHWNLLLV